MGGITARSMLWAKRLLVVGALCLGLAFALNGCSQAPSQNAPESADGAAQTDQATQNETRTFTDSAGRTVEVPAKIDRIAPAGHTATQVLLTMAPDKLVTISTELTADQAKYLGGDYANLPVTGAAFGAKGDLNKEAVAASGAQIDRKPESRTARRLGTALVNTVEPLKDTVLLLLRDADAGVAHCECRSLVLHARNDGHTATLLIIAHGIAAQIVE